MKVFISHSWKNKMAAQQIADALAEAGAEVWLDVNNLLPGEHIQSTIDEALGKIDLILLIWSNYTSGSDGVMAEINSALRLNKIIVPCILDDANPHPDLQHIKGINFFDMSDGIGRLKMVLLNYMMRGFNMHGEDSAKKMNEFLGSLETASHLTRVENIKQTGSDREKDFWVDKIQSTKSEAEERLLREQKIGKEIEAFLQQKVSELQHNINNESTCQRILHEMKTFHYAEHPAMKKFIDHVQQICESFTKNVDYEKTISQYKEGVEEKLQSSFTQLKQAFGWLVPEFLFKNSYDNLSYFFQSSSINLQLLLKYSEQQEVHELVKDCVTELIAYLNTPGGVIDNSQYGVLGYADDAYLIHSIVGALQTEGLIDTGNWNIDWALINAGSDVAFSMIGNEIKQQLDNNISNFCQALINKYAPQQTKHQEQLQNLQKARDQLWEAKIIGMQGNLNYGHNPIW